MNGMEYIAGRRLMVGGVWIEPGSPVPGCEHWPSFSAHVSNGSLVPSLPKTVVALASTDSQRRDFADSLQGLLKAELIKKAKKADVASYGSKSDIADRLVEAKFDK